MAHWAITWTACWSAISQPRQEAIEAYLQEKIEKLSGNEINAAVEQIAGTWDNKTHGSSPGIGLLISVIRGARRRQAGINTEEPYEYTIRARNLSSADPGGRWDVICDIATACGCDWGREAEKAAASMQGGYVLPWWVDKLGHPLAVRQESKPPGITGWHDCMMQAASDAECVMTSDFN